MPVELFLASAGEDPFVVENLSLFLQINVIVECIIVKLRIMQSFILGLTLVSLIKDVENFNDSLHDLLLENLVHYHNCNVKLELRNDLSHFILWNAIGDKVCGKACVFAFELRSESVLASRKEFNQPLKDIMESVKVLHLLQYQELCEASYGHHVVLRTIVILSFRDVLCNFEEQHELFL